MHENRLNAILDDLATCLCRQIAADGLPCTCFCGRIAGLTAIQEHAGDCQDGACGIAWIRVASLYPSVSIGEPDTRPGNCGSQLGVDVDIGIVRCMTVGYDDGEPPTHADALESADLQMRDAFAIHKAVSCCTALGSKDYRMGLYIPTGPQGGLVGGAWTISLVV